MYQCGYCIFKSKRKYNLKIHEERNHINLTNHATPKMSVQQNVNSSNIQNQHNSQYGNEQNTHHNGTTMYGFFRKNALFHLFITSLILKPREPSWWQNFIDTYTF